MNGPDTPKAANNVTAASDGQKSVPIRLKAAHSDAVTLDGIIRAAETANLAYDGATDQEVADLIRNAIDGLLEAAQKLSRRLLVQIDETHTLVAP